MTYLIALAFTFLVASAEATLADPVTTAIAAISTFVGGLGVVGAALLQFAIGTTLSLIAKAKARRGQGDRGGIQTDVTLTGGTNSESFILGYYGTSGTWVCPPLSRGERLNTLTYVIDIGGLPGQTLKEVFVNGELLLLDGLIEHGQTVSSTKDSFNGLVSLTYFDGSQTTAPAFMLENYGGDPNFPWTEDMIGIGRCFAILEFEADDKVFSGLPQVRFGVQGIPVYDPRDGQFKASDNLALLAYSVLRGFDFPDGSRWGGEASFDDLPIDVWAAAMNEADRPIDIADGNTEPQFRAGFEINTSETEPAEVLERLMDACTGDLAEEGGSWFIRIGAPPLPVAFLTDADLIVDAPMSLTPFSSLADSVNALTLQFPNPSAAWEVTEAERILRPDLEAKDEGRRLQEDLSLSACPYHRQVQRVGAAYIGDAQRDVRHGVTLPPDFAHLPPLSVVGWSSEHNQYNGKLFSIEKKIVHPHDLLTAVEIREVDPLDHAWSVDDELPHVTGFSTLAPLQPYVLEGVTVEPVAIRDSEGVPRRVAIQIADLPILPGVDWRVQDYSGLRMADGTAMDVGNSFLITQGILPNQSYLVGLRMAGGGNVDWAYFEVDTENIGLGISEFDDTFWDALDDQAQASVERLFGNIRFAIDRLAEAGLESAAGQLLETARVEGVVEESHTELQAEVDGVRADLVQNYVTAATQTAALAQISTTLGAEIDGVSANLSQNYTTIAQVDQAVAAVRSSLSAQIGTLNATLDDDYYTIAQTDNVVSAATRSIATTVNGLNTEVNQVQSSVDGVMGTYGVEVNNNGVISGFGLVSELIAGRANSSFDVVADVFRVSSVDGSIVSSVFEVRTSGTTINGVYAPPAAYLRNAIIRNGSITNAKIGNAQVDTLKIGDNAVTIPKGQTLTPAVVGNNSWRQVNSVRMTLPQRGQVTLIWFGSQFYSRIGTHPGLGVRFKMSRVTGNNADSGLENDWLCYVSTHSLPAGTHTITVDWRGETNVVTLRQRTLSAFGSMR